MKKRIAVVGMLLFCFSATAAADELSELKEMVKQQQMQMQKLMERIEQLEAKQSEQDVVMEEKIALAVEEKSVDTLPDSIKWVENMKIYGDLRYRHESIDDTDTGSDKRNRNRIRARVGVKAKLNDEWDVNVRLASGSSDSPTSTNQTLGDSSSSSFSSKEIWLDLAYARWRPKAIDGMSLFMGKMKNPFYKVGKNQLVWDGDVTPEGIAASMQFDLSEYTKAVFTGGGYWLAERSGDADSSFWGIQGYLKHKFENKTSLLGGVTYYDLGNVDDRAPVGVSLNGNTSNGSGGYMYDFDLIEGFMEYGFDVHSLPSAVYANYIENTAAPAGRDTAYSIGCRLNKAKKPGSWQVGYQYREVESDAVFAGLTDSDFILGGTGGRGHKLGFKYQAAKNVQAGLTYFINQRDSRSGSGNQDVDLLQADLIFKF